VALAAPPLKLRRRLLDEDVPAFCFGTFDELLEFHKAEVIEISGSVVVDIVKHSNHPPTMVDIKRDRVRDGLFFIEKMALNAIGTR